MKIINKLEKHIINRLKHFLLKYKMDIVDGLDINDQNNEIKIDKNGIVIKTNDETNNTDTIFNVQNGEILLKVGNYGIKITSSGISTTSSNGETWTQLNQ